MDWCQSRGLYFYEPETGTISAPLADKVAENIHGCIGSIIDKEGNLFDWMSGRVYIIDLHSRSAAGGIRIQAFKLQVERSQLPSD